jgi:ATP-binding cassette subfamily B protein
MASIMIVMLPVLLAIILFVSAKGIPMYARVQQKLDAVVRLMRENITGIRVVKALSKENYEMKRFAKANQDMKTADVQAVTVMSIPSPLMQMFINAGLTAVVLLGASRVNQGLMKPGVILAFLTYFNMIAMGVMGLNRIFMTMSRASASADRIQAVLDAEDQTKAVIEDETAEESDEVIAFDHVNFAYGESISHETKAFAGERRENALDDISFTATPGTTTAIIGGTGSGKSSLISLIPRLFDVTEGAICLDGQDIRTMPQKSLRDAIGYVPQKGLLFTGTIADNLRYGKSDATMEELERAAATAQSLSFIKEMPNGFDTEVAQGGTSVSGGQKQRLSIARALVKDPQVLIFDDSFSALDFKTDAALRKALKESASEKTLIIVAQRINTIMDADQILVMEDGRIVGRGTHEELLRTCELYKEIAMSQLSEEELGKGWRKWRQDSSRPASPSTAPAAARQP